MTAGMIGRRAIIEELMSFLPNGLSKWQQAKRVEALAHKPAGTFQMVGSGNAKRPMSQSEAIRLVEEAKRRIALADEGETEVVGACPMVMVTR